MLNNKIVLSLFIRKIFICDAILTLWFHRSSKKNTRKYLSFIFLDKIFIDLLEILFIFMFSALWTVDVKKPHFYQFGLREIFYDK